MPRARGCIDSREGINCCNSGGTLAGNFGECALGTPAGFGIGGTQALGRNTSAWRGLRQQRLIERERRKVSVLADCHFGCSHFVGPFDVGNAVTVHRFFCGKIFLEVVI